VVEEGASADYDGDGVLVMMLRKQATAQKMAHIMPGGTPEVHLDDETRTVPAVMALGCNSYDHEAITKDALDIGLIAGLLIAGGLALGYNGRACSCACSG